MTDESILKLVSHASTREQGLRELVLKYQMRLYDVVRRRVRSHESADDVLQNTFLKIFRHIGSFENRSELFTWMYRIACNELIDYQKRNSKLKLMELDNHTSATADAFVDTDHLAQHLEEAITRLPERQQMVFRYRYFDELSYKEISDLLNVTEGALKASFHHAAKKIEEEFRSKQIL